MAGFALDLESLFRRVASQSVLGMWLRMEIDGSGSSLKCWYAVCYIPHQPTNQSANQRTNEPFFGFEQETEYLPACTCMDRPTVYLFTTGVVREHTAPTDNWPIPQTNSLINIPTLYG